ncbi:MAG: DEAD/DEAH box helicase [Spirochaetales bacterium]|nr:DEAD/DEAH box helicase [Spirochaetales bacterium]
MGHPILQSLYPDFLPVIRQRGREYQRQKRVRLAEADPGDPGRVLAFVQGSRRYTVQLLFEALEVHYSCTCPYFLDRDRPCKHLWAVILQLERQGFFERWERARFPDAVGKPDTGESESAQRGLWDLPGGNRTEHGTAEDPAGRRMSGSGRSREEGLAQIPDWKLGLDRIRRQQVSAARSGRSSWPPDRQILYIFDIPQTLSGGRAMVQLYFRNRGEAVKPVSGGGFRLEDLWQLPDPLDREILGVLRVGAYQNAYDEETYSYRLLGREIQLLCPGYLLDVDLVRLLLPKMAGTGRLFLKNQLRADLSDILRRGPIVWDGGSPWEFVLSLLGNPSGRKVRLEGMLKKEGRTLPLSEPQLLLMGGLMFVGGSLVRYTADVSFPWISLLRMRKHLSVAREELPRFLGELLSFPDLRPLEIDPSLGIGTIACAPQPRLRMSRTDRLRHSATGGGLIGELSFAYGQEVLSVSAEDSGAFFEKENLVVLRDGRAEREALELLLGLGFRHVYEHRSRARVLKLRARKLPEVVDRLLQEGWQVEAEGKLLRSATAVDVHVVSGLDWFEIRGGVRFGAEEIGLPELLKALRKGGDTVRLGDGSFGVLPGDWLKQQGFLLEMGELQVDHLRFRSSQALLIDLLLQGQPESRCDEFFVHLRDRLKGFAGIRPVEAPGGFTGSLRGYQRDGLGWFDFLDEFGFGGCLADDMGLGKTVQVLALLERRRNGETGRRDSEQKTGAHRRRQEPAGASLVVVPKSLVFNWKQEAARFTPGLRILEYTGPARRKESGRFGRYDLVLTTYGTMRNDVALLKDYPFDYIILDEAQLIKNAGSLTAKAARLLQGRRRLALSGTPIENHLGELWSLFEFLNPGMLGGVSFFRKQMKKSREKLGQETRDLLAGYLRPFILRRTKEQVAPELPDKVEQTLFCELEPAERRRYDELKRYYQSSLGQRIESDGLGRSKIQVLEALLRLRQAACHPGLLDERSRSRSSSKLDLLLQQLEDVVSEERKALVFSQFTSLLKILRARLDALGFTYEYLDGRTRDRAGRVRRFQEDPECRLFLISLKAGGLGLNLTAAEYVFLLDPWWNPASEAQAIDRTHRIGQDRKVFAYRLIVKDTVEEKVLELQQSKRELADAIINRDRRLIGDLSREDLALLLS